MNNWAYREALWDVINSLSKLFELNNPSGESPKVDENSTGISLERGLYKIEKVSTY